MRTRRETGITLIALVITIIILLILAGISIQAITNTGLFENAKLSKEKYENAQLEEQNILADYEKQIDKYTVTIDMVDPLDYALITADGIYNCKLKNSEKYYLLKEVTLTGSNAIGYEGYDNDLTTQAVVKASVDKGYIYVDESAIGKKIRIKGAYNCGAIACNESGTRLKASSTKEEVVSDLEMVIPENTKYILFSTYATRLGNLRFNEITVE